MSVGLVIVSHSEKLALGVVELAAQMASGVRIVAAGGTDGAVGAARIGTSLERIMDALDAADSGDGVLILTDLGSAVMTAESALEIMGDPLSAALADAPLVEGAVAAAVAAQSGAGLDAVRKAAETAWQPAVVAPAEGGSDGLGGPGAAGSGTEASAGQGGEGGDDAVCADLLLINPMGLHARPAAALAGALGGLAVEISINDVDGQSVMMLMTLAAGMGSRLRVRATGPDAGKAVDLVRSEVERGFGEM
ncbi:dihydroxyacetone kinase phosphoryl donor subunit DhaM [Arthrobacter sp. A5]|uniref:dihydroxyacetone kinase phosphoryl donor subunit DhaM n=1 Tax=Arthrobacter sp. A5 TaxID=576926 RepID=UPI003DA7ECCD